MYKSIFHIANAKKRKEVNWQEFAEEVIQIARTIMGKRLHSVRVKRRSFVLYASSALNREERTSLGRLLVRTATRLVAFLSIYKYKRKDGKEGTSRQLLRLKKCVQV